MIRFCCEHCAHKISVQDKHAGRQYKCPKCKNVAVVPTLEETPARSTKPLGFTCPKCEGQIEVSENSRGELVQCPHCGGYIKAPSEEIGPAGNHRLPWLVDVFLYPLNLAGIIHLISLWLLIFLLCPLVIALLGLGTEYIPVVYLLPVSYSLYYFAECIRDSAAGRHRAPDFWMHPAESDKWDCVLQLLVVLGCIAVCFWPVAVFYIVTERSDLIYWLLLACGGFFFPMALLAVVLFDSFNALNPILIIGSIFRTLLPYCGMVLFFYAGALLFMEIDSPVNRFWLLPAVPFMVKVVQLYMIFVAVGLLGRFYHRNEKKLNWEV